MSVLAGVDVLVRDEFRAIRGQRVGLVTNHTGLTADGQPTAGVLHAAPEVDLRVLFAPEHGIRGLADEKLSDSTDTATGLPVYSLYGQTMRPTADQLKGLDALVFDIQDIGCRFYTYISTLGNCMEECAKNGLHLVVLDRPNPITGGCVEGPVAESDRPSFVSWHPITVRHGMTVGELARLFNAERRIGAGLVVVPCDGWRRSMWWDETGLTWVNPSPNMRSMTQAALYPGIGLLETTNVSVGRGTDTPFEVVGAPWLDGRRLAAELNTGGLPGVRFVPIRFTPSSSVHAGAACGGVNIVITDRNRFRCLRTGLEIALALRRQFEHEWRVDLYDRLLVRKPVLEMVKACASVAEIERFWERERSAFEKRRRPFLVYS